MNKKKLQTNKKAMAVQTVFYIFMSIIMLAIMVYGINKIFLIQDQISESERLEIQTQLKKTLEHCKEPLNKGSSQIIKLNNQKFNSICLIGNDITNTNNKIQQELNPEQYAEIQVIANTNDNVILLKTKTYENTIQETNIISTFSVSNEILESHCYINKENSKNLYFKYICK